ncbi:MAG: metalloregulator ArsR/SmtB family transcription factor [Candidatus Omnitrophota bacterium]
MNELAYKIKSDFLGALAHPLRLQIIELLKNGEKNVNSIAKTLSIQQSSLSRHLTILREAGILKTKKEGTVIYYDIEDHDIYHVLRPIAEMLRKRLKKTETVLNSLGR